MYYNLFMLFSSERYKSRELMDLVEEKGKWKEKEEHNIKENVHQ